MRKAANFFLLCFFFCHSVPISWAKNDSNNIDNEVLTRLTRLEIENRQQQQEIKFLERKVERHENVIGNIEMKLKQEDLKTEENLQLPSQHLDEEGSSTTYGVNKEKRPARLLSPSVLYGRKPKKNKTDQPSNCQDLNDLGHTLNGFYLVKNNKLPSNKENKNFQTVYCDFQDSPTSAPIKEIEMGYLDTKNDTGSVIKNQGVNFYAHKACQSSNDNGIIPFDLVKVNLGGGLNSSNGVFTTPKSGFYKFMFNALKEFSIIEGLHVDIRVNRIVHAESITPHGVNPHSLSLHAILKLKKGDRVDLYKKGGRLGCNPKDPNSHFSGSLLVEY